MQMPKLLLTVLVIFLLEFFLTNEIFAQTTATGPAVRISIDGETLENGDVLCGTTEGFKRCDLTYDNAIFGVVTDEPAIAIESDLGEGSYLVVSTGKVNVKATNTNGAIALGDLITSSGQSGVAMRASRNGYVLGTALENFDEESGELLIAVNIHPTVSFTDARGNLIEVLRQAVSAPLLTPLAALRYIIAAIVVVTSFVLGFIYFGRLAKTGIESVARNPLANRTIQLTVFLQVGITIAIVFVGLALAYLILAI